MDGRINGIEMGDSSNRWLKNVSPVKLIVVGVTVMIVVVLAISVFMINKRNHEEALKVVTMEYPSSLPSECRLNIGMQLKNLLVAKFGISEDTMIMADVRDGSYKETVSQGITTATFLVDIDDVKQTYIVTVSWSDGSVELSDAILISCPSESESKYPDSYCKGMYDNTDDVENRVKYSLYSELPVTIDRFDFASREAIYCEIRGDFDENNQLVLKIIDYSGGLKDEAIEKIREMGYNPDDYEIIYFDKSPNV